MDEAEGHAEDRFRLLFGENFAGLLAYALRRVTDPADAADIVAETFLVAWRRAEDVPAGGEARLWLFGVARRAMANQRRGKLRRSNLADRLRHELTDLMCRDHAPAVETTQVVRSAMAKLDPDDRELLRLTSWEGLSPSEVAVVFRLPAGTVRSRLHRARVHLRAQLEEAGWGDERNDAGGHVPADEHALVQDPGCER